MGDFLKILLFSKYWTKIRNKILSDIFYVVKLYRSNRWECSGTADTHTHTHTHTKMKFSIKNFFSKCDQIRNLETFTKEIVNGEFHFAFIIENRCS